MGRVDIRNNKLYIKIPTVGFIMAKNKPKEVRIQQIIDAAVREFLEKGYEGTSMESIARRAGLSKGGLYYHFDSKDEILLEANNQYFQPIEKLMKESIEDLSPVNGLQNYITGSIRHWASHPREIVFTFLSFSKMLQKPDRWGLDSYTDMIFGFYKGLYDAAIKKGEMKEHNTSATAAALMAALDGITTYVSAGKIISQDEAVNYFIGVFVDQFLK